MQQDSLITIKEARKILGKANKHLSDDEVKNLIDSFDCIAKLLIKHESVLKNSVL